jgi:ElaB/YqjD/DUF883 family membrane-anchored ribosome-binding protein
LINQGREISITCSLQKELQMSAIQNAGEANRSAATDSVRPDHSASDRIRDQARVVKKDVQELGGIVREAAQEKLGELREGAAEYYEQARGKARHAEDAVGEFISRRPITSVLLGVGLGLLFGRFWMRR